MGDSSRSRETIYLRIDEASDPIGVDVGMAAGTKWGVGLPAATGQLHIDQPSTSGAMPCLLLDQADTSEEFIRFIGTSAADNSMSLLDAADLSVSGNIVGWLRIYVEDIKSADGITDGIFFVPFYDSPTAP